VRLPTADPPLIIGLRFAPLPAEQTLPVLASPFPASREELNQAITDIQEVGHAIRQHQQTDEQLERLLVAAFAMHPCLDQMHPNLKDNAAWAQQIIRKRSGLSNRLKSLLGYFSRDYILQPTHKRGSFGTRARITLLLCWLIGHKLSKEQRFVLVSTAIQTGLRHLAGVAQEGGGSMAEGNVLGLLSQLDALRVFVERIAIQFGTSVPANEAGLSDLWGSFDRGDLGDTGKYARTYWARRELPPEQLKEFDLRKAPHILLEALPLPASGVPFILMPTTKLDEAMITLCAHAFGLGNKATSQQEIALDAFWNADPPPDPSPIVGPIPADPTQDTPLHHFTQSQLQYFVCYSNCEQPCHLTCNSDCSEHCNKRSTRWTHDSFLRTIILNWYCMQASFSETSKHIPATIAELSATGLTLPPDDRIFEAANITKEIRQRLTDTTNRVGWYLAQLVADEFTPAAVVALQGLCLQKRSTMWGFCLLSELHLVFQDNPDKHFHQTLLSTAFTTLPTPRWEMDFGPRKTSIVLQDCTCGKCAEVVQVVEDAARNRAPFSVEHFEMVSTKCHMCGAGIKYWREVHERAAKLVEDILRNVVTDESPSVTIKEVLTATATLGIDLNTPSGELSVDQRAKIIFFAHLMTPPPNELQQHYSHESQPLGYLYFNFMVTYGPWLPQLASTPDDTRCFILHLNPPFIKFSLPFLRSELSATHYLTLYMRKLLPSQAAAPPQITNRVFNFDDLESSPPDDDLLIDILSAGDGAVTLTGRVGGLSFQTSCAPFICRGRRCFDVNEHSHTNRPVWAFMEFINLRDLDPTAVYIVNCTIEGGLHEDAAGLVTIFASKFHKRVYLRDRAQCVECALAHMGTFNCSILCV
jgi:hypothetical protein